MSGLARLVAAEIAVIVGMGVAIVVHANLARRRARRRRGPRARALDALAQVAVGGSGAAEGARQVLRGVSMRTRLFSVFEVASVVEGTSRVIIKELADDLGVTSEGRRLLSERRRHRRLLGARLLMALGEPPIARLLEDPHVDVQQVAISWIAEQPEPGAIARVVRFLGASTPLLRFVAQDALLRVGSPAVPALTDRLAALDADRERADPAELVTILAVLGGLAEPRSLDAVLLVLRHPAPTVRAAAVQGLRVLGGRVNERRIAGMLGDRDPIVRAASVSALGALHAWRSGPLVRARLDDPDRSVRREAAVALGRMGPVGRILLRGAVVDGGEGSALAQQILNLAHRDVAGVA